MNLHELSPAPGSKRASVRVGRGLGSGLGKTSVSYTHLTLPTT